MNAKHDTPRHTRTDRYGFEGPRWWWTSTGAGGLASTAIVAILMTAGPGSATPIEVDRYAGSTPAASTTERHERVPVAEPPNLPDGWRQCFMWQSHWNSALDGPQPLCPEDPGGDEGQSRRTTTGFSMDVPSRAAMLPIP